MQELLQQLINGLSLGAIYALIAVGYTMVYGILQLINFAHGDIFMVGAIISFYAASRKIAPVFPWWVHIAIVLVLIAAIGVPWLTGRSFRHALRSVAPFIILYLALIPGLYVASLLSHWHGLAEPSWGMSGFALLLAVVTCGIFGFTIERLAYRPLRDKPRINSLITAIGISLLLEYGGQHPMMFGATPQSYPQEMVPGVAEPLPIHWVVISRIDLMVLLITLLLMVTLSYIVLKTRTGLALRAISYRFDTSALMGIDINRIISFTFVLGSCLAAVAGVLYAVKYPKVDPLMGLLPGIKAFVAAVFGGIGNIAGAVAGGIILGLMEVLVVGYLPGGSQYRDGVAFVILIVILLVKPSGLLGTNVTEKV